MAPSLKVKVEVKEEVISLPLPLTTSGQEEVTVPLVPDQVYEIQLWAWKKVQWMDRRILILARLQMVRS